MTVQNLNKHPINQAALKHLRAAKAGGDPTWPHLHSLLLWGFERDGLEIPGPGQDHRHDLELAAGQLGAAAVADPERLLRWFVTNPEGDDPESQEADLLALLESEENPELAWGRLAEWFQARLAAENPYYQSAASELR